jgi:hypothetical protein
MQSQMVSFLCYVSVLISSYQWLWWKDVSICKLHHWVGLKNYPSTENHHRYHVKMSGNLWLKGIIRFKHQDTENNKKWRWDRTWNSPMAVECQIQRPCQIVISYLILSSRHDRRGRKPHCLSLKVRWRLIEYLRVILAFYKQSSFMLN